MRIDKNQRLCIINIVHKFDPYAKVRLFGSRLNDDARGGDIDLLIESKTIGLKKNLSYDINLKKN